VWFGGVRGTNRLQEVDDETRILVGFGRGKWQLSFVSLEMFSNDL